MVKYIEDTIHVESKCDLEQLMCKYNCKTLEELDEFLWAEYGIVLVLNNCEEDNI